MIIILYIPCFVLTFAVAPVAAAPASVVQQKLKSVSLSHLPRPTTTTFILITTRMCYNLHISHDWLLGSRHCRRRHYQTHYSLHISFTSHMHVLHRHVSLHMLPMCSVYCTLHEWILYPRIIWCMCDMNSHKLPKPTTCTLCWNTVVFCGYWIWYDDDFSCRWQDTVVCNGFKMMVVFFKPKT